MRLFTLLLALSILLLKCKIPKNIETTETAMVICNKENAEEIVLKKIKSADPSVDINGLNIKFENWEKDSVFFFSVTTDTLQLVDKGYIAIVNKKNCEIIEFKRTL